MGSAGLVFYAFLVFVLSVRFPTRYFVGTTGSPDQNLPLFLVFLFASSVFCTSAREYMAYPILVESVQSVSGAVFVQQLCGPRVFVRVRNKP